MTVLAGPDNKLTTRPVKVLRSTRDEIFIADGVKAGEQVLATVLAVITEGLDIRPVSITITLPPPAPATTTPAGAPK